MPLRGNLQVLIILSVCAAVSSRAHARPSTFFAGAGFQLYTIVHLGAGATFQQVPRLVSGLGEGQVIASADDLQTDNEFKWGPYFQVTVSLPK